MRTRVKGRKIVIAIAGPHGAGRTTQAVRLARAFGLKHVSTGTLFRERAEELGIRIEEMTRIASEDPAFDRLSDDRAKKETRKGGVVLDATLSGWMAEHPDLRIYLTAPFSERVRRIHEREGRTIKEVERETELREKAEKERFLKYYGINLDDLTIYDLILNTGLFDIDATANILKNVVDAYLDER